MGRASLFVKLGPIGEDDFNPRAAVVKAVCLGSLLKAELMSMGSIGR